MLFSVKKTILNLFNIKPKITEQCASIRAGIEYLINFIEFLYKIIIKHLSAVCLIEQFF